MRKISILFFVILAGSVFFYQQVNYGKDSECESCQESKSAENQQTQSSVEASKEISDSQTPVVVNGDNVNYQTDKNIITASGNVEINYKGVEAYCEEAEVNTRTSIGTLKGDVKIVHKQGTVFGENVIYDFENKTAEIKRVFLESEPFYVSGKTAEKISDKEYELNDACFTTCGPLDEESEFLDYEISASQVELYPGEKVVARDIFLKVGGVPVFWFPYYMQPAKDKLPRVTLSPGSDSDLGLYMLSAWRYYFNEGFKGRIHLDYYQDKGFGRGVTHKYKTDNFGSGIAKLYYISDKDKKSFDTTPPVHVGADRYKAQIRHNWQMTPKLRTKVEFHKFSDQYFMHDYFYREYERDRDPESYILTNYSLPYASLSMLAQKRVNRFYNRTEYLPQLKADVFRRRISQTNFYFGGDYSVSNLAYKPASSSLEEDDDAVRLDAYNQLTYQDKFGWLNVQPYAGVRETYYSKNNSGKEDILRTAFYSGIELSTKIYKAFNSPIDILGLKADKTRHIITPRIEYDYIHRPTVSRSSLSKFDSVDEVDRKNKVKFTLGNKWQAKREEKVWDLLYLAPSFTYLFNEEGRGSHFGIFENDFEFRPNDNLYLEQNYQYDLDSEKTKEVNSDIIWESPKTNISVGHRYVNSEDASEIRTSFSYKFAPTWEFHNRLRYEEENEEFEEQEFFLRKELNCWFVDFGVTLNEDNDKTIWAVFKVKAFPEVGVNFHGSYSRPKD